MKKCIYCGKNLTGKKQKYCNSLCSYRYKSIINTKYKKLSKSQCLRMSRAGEKQRKGKLGVRFN
jgi:hypothetical protein